MSKPDAVVKSIPIYDAVTIDGEDVTAEITAVLDQLRIDANNLSEEAQDHPSLFGRIALLAEEASSSARYAKRRLELERADVDGKIRRESSVEGGKKPTETQIENMVTLDPTIVELTEEMLIAERNAGMISALRQSLTHRRDMLNELLRDRRHESKSYEE